MIEAQTRFRSREDRFYRLRLGTGLDGRLRGACRLIAIGYMIVCFGSLSALEGLAWYRPIVQYCLDC